MRRLVHVMIWMMLTVSVDVLRAQDSLNVSLSGQRFFNFEAGIDVTVAGNYAFMAATYSGLVVFDVSNPAQPVMVGNCPLPGIARASAYYFGYLLVACDAGGLQVLNVFDPPNPVRVASYPTSGPAYDVAATNDYAFIAQGTGGLMILEMTTPQQPLYTGSFDTGGNAVSLAINDSWEYAFVADEAGGVRAINITDVAAPYEVGSYVPPGGIAFDVALNGNYAYVADGSNLVTLNVSNPASPTQVNLEGWSPYRLLVNGNFLFTRAGDGIIRAWWLGNPAAPSFVNLYSGEPAANGFAVAGGYCYVACTTKLLVMPLPNQIDPWYPAGSYQSGTATSTAYQFRSANQQYGFVANGESGLKILSVAHAGTLPLVGSYDTPGYAWDVAVSGNYAYVADQSTLQIINTSNVSAPSLADFLNMSYAVGVAVQGNYVYVADWWGGLRIIDITNPSAVWQVSQTITTGYAYRVAVSGNYAYIATDGGGLRIFNVSDPSAPTEVGSLYTGTNLRVVTVSGNYAYVAEHWGGLKIVDISNPAAPVEAGYFDTPGSVSSVAVAGHYANVADNNGGLSVVEICNPNAPYLAGYYHTPGNAFGIALRGNRFALVAMDYGLGVYDLDLVRQDDPVTNGTWTLANSPYCLCRDLTIPAGQTLRIEPGVEVRFCGRGKFIVNGSLIANGTPQDSIRFTCDTLSNPDKWGGIRLQTTQPCSLSYCVVENGRAAGSGDDAHGGGIYMNGAYSTRMYGCTVRRNRADEGSYGGGGLFMTNSEPVLDHCVFENNVANSGGGITCYNSTPVFNACTIRNNIAWTTSNSVGGGLDFRRGAMIYAMIEGGGTVIEGNNSYSAGGLYVFRSNLRNFIIRDNSAGVYGGGAYLYDIASLERCVIIGNSANQHGGCYLNGSALVNCTVAWNNGLSWGSGVTAEGSSWIENTIVAHNYTSCGVYFGYLSNVTLHYSDIFDNAGGNFCSYTNSVPPGLGVLSQTNLVGDSCDFNSNIYLNPLFVDPMLRDWRLRCGSPCIDAGTGPLDPDMGTWPDIGAYYFPQLYGLQPMAPHSVVVKNEGGAVCLHWPRITQDVNGDPLSQPVAYRLERSATAGFESPERLTVTPDTIFCVSPEVLKSFYRVSAITCE